MAEKLFLRIIVGWMAALWFSGLSVSADQSGGAGGASGGGGVASPWWKQEKIRFFWGEWVYGDRAGIPVEETMENVARVGATVVADGLHRYGWVTREGKRELVHWGGKQQVRDRGVGYDLAMARAAQKYGMRYFASIYETRLADVRRDSLLKEARPSMDREGKPYRPGGNTAPCPLNKSFYDQWFCQPAIRAAQTGFVDGLHLDWEGYYGGEGGICYCDECLTAFLESLRLEQDLPNPEDRYAWLEERRLVTEYEKSYQHRRKEMFRQIEQCVHKVHPTFVFSGYSIHTVAPMIAEGLSTPEVPFLVIDARHYQEDHTRPWWDTFQADFHRRGFLRIGGTWDNAAFGGQPYSDVSVTQWMYDMAMHADGVWLWFEEEVTPDLWRAFWVGDRRIRSTEAKVGKYQLHGKRDIHFVTPVEWTGSPELTRAIKQITYHLGNEHLVHVNNVDTDRPLQVRLRFPRLGKGDGWSVRDPIAGLYYCPDADQVSVVWDKATLDKGLVVSLEKRSELFLLLSPAAPDLDVAPTQRLVSQEIEPMSDHVTMPRVRAEPAAPAGKERLAYLATEVLDYLGPQNWTIGNAIFSTNGTQSNVMDLPVRWRFKLDPNDVGIKENWWKLERLDDWDTIRTDDFWTTQGYDYHGVAWYAVEFNYPETAPSQKLSFQFGSVDGYADIYLDGTKIAEQKVTPYEMWDQPFSRPIGAPLRPGKHILVLRVEKREYAAGIWKPVWIDAGDGKRLYGVKGHLWEPKWSPDGKWIAFSHYANGRGQINLMDENGSDVANISNNANCDRSPIWSPDGKRIAFLSDRDGDWEIYVMEADGSSQERLTSSPGLEANPVWSPDGNYIAFESDRGGDTDVFVMNADGSVQRSVTNMPGHELDPAWSPDGAHIAFSATGSPRDLMVVGVDGTGRRPVLRYCNDLGPPCWSPDGKRIAAAFRGPPERDTAGVVIIDPDKEGGNTMNASLKKAVVSSAIRPHPGGGRHVQPSWYSTGSASRRWLLKTFGGLSWSADSKYLAFSSDMGDDGYFYVYTISPDGGEPKRLESARSAWLQETSWCPE